MLAISHNAEIFTEKIKANIQDFKDILIKSIERMPGFKNYHQSKTMLDTHKGQIKGYHRTWYEFYQMVDILKNVLEFEPQEVRMIDKSLKDALESINTLDKECEAIYGSQWRRIGG